MNDLEAHLWYLGIHIKQAKDSVELSQRPHISTMLERLGIQDCKPVRTLASFLLNDYEVQLYHSMIVLL
jgi:hypothetical protein